MVTPGRSYIYSNCLVRETRRRRSLVEIASRRDPPTAPVLAQSQTLITFELVSEHRAQTAEGHTVTLYILYTQRRVKSETVRRREVGREVPMKLEACI